MDSEVIIPNDEIRYEFRPSSKGILRQIAVSKSVDPKKFKQKIEPGEGDVKFRFLIEGDLEVHEELIRKLQSLESQLAISTNGSLTKVFWETNTRDYIPETEDEESQIGIRSSNINKIPQFPQPIYHMTEEKFANFVRRLDTFADFDIPLSFWREGFNELQAMRFIQSFYNSYFVIEGFCANGKTSENKVLREFKRCPELVSAVEKLLPSILTHRHHKKNLQALYEESNCNQDIDGTLRLLVRMRGNLHHVFFSSSRQQGTPFNQDRYVSLAILAKDISRILIELKARSRDKNSYN